MLEGRRDGEGCTQKRKIKAVKDEQMRISFLSIRNVGSGQLRYSYSQVRPGGKEDIAQGCTSFRDIHKFQRSPRHRVPCYFHVEHVVPFSLRFLVFP